MKKGLLLFVVLVLALTAVSGAVMAEDRPVVHVASNVNIPYYIFYDENEEVHGYEADLFKAVWENAGYDVEFTDVDWNGLLTGLQAEKWDMACSNIYITAEREEAMDFTEPFEEAYDVAVAGPESGIKSFEDLKGKKIGTATGTSEAAWTSGELQEKYGPFEIVGYDVHETQWMDLEIGRIDAITIGVLGTIDYPQFEIIGRADNRSMIGCAVRTGSELKAIFDASLKELKENGTTAEIYHKYIDLEIPEGSAIITPFDEPYVPAAK